MNTIFQEVLQEYIEKIVPAMIRNGYYRRPAKRAFYQGGRRGSQHIDQSLLTHILNGVFGMVQCLDFLAEDVQLTDEKTLRQALALYTTHDLHKMDEYAVKQETGSVRRSQFDQNLDDYRREIEFLGLPGFADTTPQQHRVAAVSLMSPKVGDLSECPAGTGLLVDLVHMADCIASMTHLEEYPTLQNRLMKLLPLSKAKTYSFYYHRLDDLRGLITNLLHNCVADVLQETANLYPLLYFPDGILYIGRSEQALVGLNELLGPVVERISCAIKGNKDNPEITNGAFSAQYLRFQKFAFLFLDSSGLIGLIRKFAGGTAPKRFIRERISQNTEDYSHTVEDIYKAFNITEEADEQYNDHIFAAARFMAAGRKLLEKALPEQKNATFPLLEAFCIESRIYEEIQQYIPEKRTKGNTYDDCNILAWYYLSKLRIGGRSAWSVPVDLLIDYMGARLESYLQPYLTVGRCMEIAEEELPLRDTMIDYLREHLVFSWDLNRVIQEDIRWKEYHKARSGSQKKFCSICNRIFPKGLKEPEIIAAIFEGEVQTFSNRAIPSGEGKAQALVWCPLCYLEYMMRKFAGTGFAEGATPGKSGRLYMFLLPDFSFTMYGLRYFEDILADFKDHTRIKLRYGSADSPTLPQLWLKATTGGEETGFKETVMGDLRKCLISEAESIATRAADHGKRMAGDQISMAAFKQTNFFVAVYEKSAYQSATDEQVPTRNELWAKAIYAGLILHQLLGVRVYISDKPYLPSIDPAAYTTALTLDGTHPLLRLIWPEGGNDGRIYLDPERQASVRRTMTLLSSLWECTNTLDTKDKTIASRLQKQMASPLAGASFYREADREGKFSGDMFRKACENLIETFGGEFMNLTKALADKSLDIFLPKSEREGKAHRYETVLRTAVEAIKKNASLEPDEIRSRVAGTLYKRLDRLRGGDTGYLACWGEELKEKTYEFAALAVDGLFVERCGRSLAKLNSMINSVADGIYFETDSQISQRFAARRAKFNKDENTNEEA